MNTEQMMTMEQIPSDVIKAAVKVCSWFKEHNIVTWTLAGVQPANSVPEWRPITTAPRDGTFILVAGPSGYTSTPLRAEVCRWEGNGWRNHSHDWFMEGGADATHWMPLPQLEC